MANFTYTYKTSDGVRREGVISAGSRDGAFAALRAQGIRPIRVFDAESAAGATGEGRRKAWTRAVAAFAAMCAVGTTSFYLGGAWRTDGRYAGAVPDSGEDPSVVEFARLRERAEACRNLHKVEMGALGLGMFRDYALIYRTKDLSPFTQALAKAYKSIEEARGRMKELFGGICSTFPPECARERFAAQKLYGEMMTEIDANEERVAADREMLRLLDSRRTGWRVEDGRIVFTDRSLEKEFEYLLRDADPAAIRWRRDFGTVESNIVRNPEAR